MDGRNILERRRLEHGVVHQAAIRRGVGGRGTDSAGAVAPNLLKLARGNVGAVVGSNGGPELVAARLVDGAEAVRVDNLGLVRDFGVDAKSVKRLRGSLGSKSARLGQEDLVLGARGRGADGRGPDVGTTVVAHGRAVTGRLRVRIVVHGHAVCLGLAGGATGSGRGHGRGSLAAVATVRELVKVQPTGKLCLLEVCSDMLVRHLLHAGLEEVVLLERC
jgi:hypothetical protein